jgi:hypothetical protein
VPGARSAAPNLALFPCATANAAVFAVVEGAFGFVNLGIAKLHAPGFGDSAAAKQLFAHLPDRALGRTRACWQSVATRDGHVAVMK